MCHECHTARQFVKRICSSGIPAEIREWSCDECRDIHGEETYEASVVRDCPRCGTLTERIGGSGHISCPVIGCGTEWCYFCGVEGRAQDASAHVEAAHEGLFS